MPLILYSPNLLSMTLHGSFESLTNFPRRVRHCMFRRPAHDVYSSCFFHQSLQGDVQIGAVFQKGLPIQLKCFMMCHWLPPEKRAKHENRPNEKLHQLSGCFPSLQGLILHQHMLYPEQSQPGQLASWEQLKSRVLFQGSSPTNSLLVATRMCQYNTERYIKWYKNWMELETLDISLVSSSTTKSTEWLGNGSSQARW